MTTRLLKLIGATLLLCGCAYSTVGPVSPYFDFKNKLGEKHPYHQSMIIKSSQGIDENARYLSAFKIVTQKEVNKAMLQSLKVHDLLSPDPENAKYILYTKFHAVSAPTTLDRSTPATAVLDYELFDIKTKSSLQKGRITAYGDAKGITDITKRAAESGRCAVRSALYQMTYELVYERKIPPTKKTTAGGCSFRETTRYYYY